MQRNEALTTLSAAITTQQNTNNECKQNTGKSVRTTGQHAASAVVQIQIYFLHRPQIN